MNNNNTKDITVLEAGADKHVMKLVSWIKQYSYTQIVQFANFFMGLVVAFWIPLNRSYLTIFIAFWVFTWLFEGNFISRFKEGQLRKKQFYVLLLPILFYLLHVLSYVFSNNKASAGFDLEVKLALIIFPLLMMGANKLYYSHRKAFLIVFVISNLVASLICLGNAFYNSISIQDGVMVFETAIYKGMNHLGFFQLVNHRFSQFSYSHLSIYQHPSYFAMYLNFSIILCYYLYRMAASRFNKIIYLVCLLFFSFMIYLLASRAGLLTLVSVFLSISIIEILLSKKVIAVALSVIFLLVIVEVVLDSRLKENFKTVYHILTQSKDDADKTDDRLIIWRCAVDATKGNLWFGVGNGDVKAELMKQYRKYNYLPGIQLKLNVHNQYLESLIAGGLVVLALLLFVLIYGVYYSITRRRYIFGSLLFIIALNLAFESMFNTMAGVIFISFFYSLLVKLDFKQLTIVEARKEIKQ